MNYCFHPDYFQYSRVLYSEASVENCIILFCTLSDEKSDLFLFDSKLIHELLSLNPQCSDMEFLSIMFDFTGILNHAVDDSQPILALKKLTAISFFLNQLLKQGNKICINEIENLFQIGKNLFFSKTPNIVNAASLTYSFTLLALSSKCRDLNALGIDMDSFFNIVRFVVDFFVNQKIINQHTLPQVITFLFNSFYCFSPKMELTDKAHHLFVDVIKAISSFNQNIQIDFNYFSLLDKIFSFLEIDSVFPKKTKIFTFSFIAVLISRKNELIDFLFDELYLGKSVQFIKDIIDKVKSTFHPVPIKIYKKLPKKELSPNVIINTNTFNDQFTVEEPKIEKSNTYQYVPFFPKNKDIKNILNSFIRICKVVPSRFFELMSKAIFVILHSKKELSLPMHSFIVYCLNSMITENTDKAIETFRPANLHLILQLEIYKSGFVKEISLNIANSLFYISQNCSTASFLHDAILKLSHDCKTLVIEEEYAINIIKCFMLCEEKVSKFFETFDIDEIISNLMYELRAIHLAAKDEEIIRGITHSRTILFEFIQMLLHLKLLKDTLITSDYFIQTLCQMMYEKNLVNCVISILGRILVSTKSTTSQFHTIIIFIQSIFDRKNELDFTDLSRRILKALVVQFHQNPTEMSIIFFHTKLLDYLINFVLYTNDKEDLFNLFKLFQDFPKFQELVKEYILDMSPFMQLEPVIKSQSDIENIKSWLWSFTCGTDCKYLDQVRPIKNVLPLSLIFHSVREDKQSLLDFISFLNKCCEADQPSALEVCSGNIPALLIEKIREYRHNESGDSFFTEVLKLLTTLSHYSMKSKDLRSLFQTMTLINGQRRPFFTQDLLKLFQNTFGMKVEMPCAFISSSGKSPLFKVKETKLLNSFSDFSIFFEFKLKTDKWKEKSELLRIVTDGNTLLLWFNHDQLILTFLDDEPLRLAIDIKFQVNVWTQIALVFSEGSMSFYADSVLLKTTKVPKFVFKTKIIKCDFARYLSCNLSCFIFANCVLDAKNINKLHYFPKYQPTSFDITEMDNFPRIFQPLFTSSISTTAIYIFNALVTHNRKLPNLAKSYVKCAADFYGQAYTLSPQPKQILRCIGGIQTIYPLFSQLDQPFSQGLLSDLFAFVAALFNNSMLNQEEFYYSNSFKIIACLLASKISNIDDDFIDRIYEMYEAIDMRFLLRQMFMDLLFNVRLWIYLPVEKQDKMYKAFIKLFSDCSLNIKKIIVTQLTFRHILMLIRVFLWSVNTNSNMNPIPNDQNKDNSSVFNKTGRINICLLDKPKIDHKSDKIDAYRPNDLSLVRANLLRLAELIEPIKFTLSDAETLIYYCLDTSDPELCSEFLTLLCKLLQSKNQILFKILTQYFTYKDFFQLILSNNEKVRVNSLNIMMLFTREELRKLLDPYTTIAWIDGIVRFINMKYTSAYFADVALSYAFGYYKKGNPIDTFVKFSKGEHISDQIEPLSVEKVMPLVMLIISKLPEKLGKIYTSEINKSVTTKRTKIINAKCWDHPFILYILSRLTVRKRTFGQVFAPKTGTDHPLVKSFRQQKQLHPGSKIIHADETTMDDSGRDILLSLSYLYADIAKMESVKYLLHVLSIMMKRDVYFVMEAVLFAILNHCLLSGKFKEDSISIFISTIFEYMFILPDIDSYAPLSFENNQMDKCNSLPSNLGFSLNSEISNDNESNFLLSKKAKLSKNSHLKSKFKYGSGGNLSLLTADLSPTSSNSTNPSTSTSEDKIALLASSSDFNIDKQPDEPNVQNTNTNTNSTNNDDLIMKRSFAREKYQDLHNIKMKCEKIPLKYLYAIRIDPLTGTWVDEKLAECFCRLLTIYPSLSNDEYTLLMFAFTISVGIQSPITFATFYPFSRTIKNYIPLKGHLSEMKAKMLICYLAGMGKIFYNTTSTHDSHKILFEDLKVLNNAIVDVFKINIPQNFANFEEFDSFYTEKEKESETNVLLLAIEKFSYEVEGSFMNNLASQVGKATTKDLSSFIDNRNPMVKNDLLSSEINHQNPQIIMQLQRFASMMKNAQAKGLKKYIEAWRVLSSEKGPWCPPEKSFTRHWKLENSLQKIMRRGLMKENYAFTNHNDAAVLRDTSNRVEDEKGQYEKEDEENYESIMKKLRITEFIGDKTVETLFQDNEISDINKVDGIKLQSDDIIIKVDAKLITMKDAKSGSLMLTSELLIFDSPSKNLDISLDQINFVFKRRYLVQDTSLEIYTTMHRSYFFEFVGGDQRDQIIHELLRINPKNLKFVQDTDESIKKIIEKTEKAWQNGKISNFDYLMAINMFAGRTYNDLGQYPIFPWVIADYTSDVLNLNDPAIYRDLTKPLGALTKERLNMLKERYNDSEGMDVPYLYGSFYSSSAVVIGYLVRVEPFTSLHIKLQSGKFDLSDRLFNSIPKAWESVTTAMMDFRELIPEFFYLPDILVNANNFDLGISISMAKSYNISTTSLNSKSSQENKGNRYSFIPFTNGMNGFPKKSPIRSLPRSKQNYYSSSSTNIFKTFHDKARELKKESIQDWQKLNISTSLLNTIKNDNNNNSAAFEEPINVNYCNNIKYCDVELPPWASSPLDFIRKNRAALESPIVSATLPFWIDMIFGITSRGEKAVQIDNVFHPFFFFETSEEFDPDLTLKKEYAACFGQAPFQIFEKPHPTKLVLKKKLKIHDPQLVFDCGKGKAILSIEADEYGYITIVNSDFNAVSNRNNKIRQLFPLNSIISPEEIDICSKLVRTKGKIALSATPWDRCFCISNINEGLLFTKRFHISKISAVSITEHRYATASFDGTVALWKKPNIPVKLPISAPKPTTTNVPVTPASSSPVLNHSNQLNLIQNSNLLPTQNASLTAAPTMNIPTSPSSVLNAASSLSSSFSSVGILSNGSNTSIGINSLSDNVSNQQIGSISSIPINDQFKEPSIPMKESLPTFQISSIFSLQQADSEESKEEKIKMQNEFGHVPVATITKHNSPVSAVDINEKANIMVSGARDGTIITSSLMSGRMIKMIKITNNTEPVNYYNNENVNEIDLNHSTSFMNIPLIQNSENENDHSATPSNSVENLADEDEYYDENGNKTDEEILNTEILSEYSIADENIEDPNIIKVSNSGTICVCISRPVNSIIKIYDINLNEISCCIFDSYIRCMTIFEWYNGREMLAVGLRNKRIEIIKIPSFKHVWTFNGFNASFIEAANNPIKALYVGTLEGKVLKIDLEEYDESSSYNDSSSNLNHILNIL